MFGIEEEFFKGSSRNAGEPKWSQWNKIDSRLHWDLKRKAEATGEWPAFVPDWWIKVHNNTTPGEQALIRVFGNKLRPTLQEVLERAGESPKEPTGIRLRRFPPVVFDCALPTIRPDNP